MHSTQGPKVLFKRSCNFSAKVVRFWVDGQKQAREQFPEQSHLFVCDLNDWISSITSLLLLVQHNCAILALCGHARSIFSLTDSLLDSGSGLSWLLLKYLLYFAHTGQFCWVWWCPHVHMQLSVFILCRGLILGIFEVMYGFLLEGEASLESSSSLFGHILSNRRLVFLCLLENVKSY